MGRPITILTEATKVNMMRKMKFVNVVVGPLETNCYLVYCVESSECLIIDPGAEPDKIIKAVNEHGLHPVAIINTHGHVDHIGANQEIKSKFGVPLYIHQDDVPFLEQAHMGELSFFLQARPSPPPDEYLEEDLEIAFGHHKLKVLHTPGHTPGSVSLLGDGVLFSGDTLFNGGVGRTDLPGGDWSSLKVSIKEKILILPEETIVLPGHGPMTTVGQEKNDNPFII